MKKLFFPLCFIIPILTLCFSCQAPTEDKKTSSIGDNNARYEMQVIQNSKDAEIMVWVLDKKTGELYLRGGFSGSWARQGSVKDVK